MASLISSITEGNRTSMDSRTNVELNGEPFKTFKFKTETLEPKIQAIQVQIVDLTGNQTLIYNNETYGIWGNFYWGSVATSSDISIIRVIPPNDTFEEEFIKDFFINTTSTTATVSQKSVFFDATSEILESKLIYNNATSVINSTMSIVSTSGANYFNLYLSNDDGSTWESVTNTEEHTFVSNGEKVKYKVVPNAVGKYLNKIIVQIN